MYKKNYLILISLVFLSSMVIATSTIPCTCNNCECEIHIHVGADDEAGDLQIYFSKKEIYEYRMEDLKTNIIVWEKYDPPFDDNKMILYCEGKNNSQPKFEIEITGEKGKLIIKNREYKIKCDWRR